MAQTNLTIKLRLSSASAQRDPAEWFMGGAATIMQAESAGTAKEAHEILRAAYRGAYFGPGENGVTASWTILDNEAAN